MKPNIILITGPPGSGKTTMARQICRYSNCKRWPSVTTRNPRPDEIEGFDYIFIGEGKFKSMREDGLLLESVQSGSGTFYGLPKPNETHLKAGMCLVAIVDLDAALYLKKELAPWQVIIKILDAPTDVLIERIRKRGDSDKELQERMQLIISEKKKADNFIYSPTKPNPRSRIKRLFPA